MNWAIDVFLLQTFHIFSSKFNQQYCCRLRKELSLVSTKFLGSITHPYICFVFNYQMCSSGLCWEHWHPLEKSNPTQSWVAWMEASLVWNGIWCNDPVYENYCVDLCSFIHSYTPPILPFRCGVDCFWSFSRGKTHISTYIHRKIGHPGFQSYWDCKVTSPSSTYFMLGEHL